MAKKQGILNLLYTVLVFVLCAVCIIVAGVAYGRYSTTETGEFRFNALDIQLVQLHGITGEENRTAGEWNDIPTEWQSSDDGYTMPFCVSNGPDADNYSKDDLIYRIELTATSGFPPEGTAVILSAGEAEKEVKYTGIPTAITADSTLYETVGPGYIYNFYDDKGREITFDLTGGELSVCDMKISVQGNADASLLSFTVIPGLAD